MVAIACVCPPTAAGDTRHPSGDTVTLRERLDFRSALTARNTVVLIKQNDPNASVAEILASLTEVYLLVGIKSWSIVDARGKPVEVNASAIREYLLSHPDIAMEVGDEADALYSEAVITPLVQRAQNSSPSTPTAASTSPTNGSSPSPRKPSRRSLTSTTRTEGTGTTSALHAGASNSSPNSA